MVGVLDVRSLNVKHLLKVKQIIVKDMVGVLDVLIVRIGLIQEVDVKNMMDIVLPVSSIYFLQILDQMC